MRVLAVVGIAGGFIALEELVGLGDHFSRDRIGRWLAAAGPRAPAAFSALMAAAIVVSPIPSARLAFAGGLFFGPAPGPSIGSLERRSVRLRASSSPGRFSYGAGLKRMRFWTFVAVTSLGILPMTLLYSILGSVVIVGRIAGIVVSAVFGPGGTIAHG